MRNLKRVLSLTLATAMLFGMMVMGAAAANEKKTAADLTDSDKVINKEAVTLLVDLGVIEGKSDGSYSPAEVVNRATMAKLITMLMMGNVDQDAFKGTTTDLNDINGHWAEGYIKFCYSNKIITGDGAGHFFPDEPVTTVQAAKMLLVATGYDAKHRGYENDSNWSVNIMRDAQTTKTSPTNIRALTKGLSVKATDPLSRDNAAQMIFNTLFVYTHTPSYQWDMGSQYIDGYSDDPSMAATTFNGLTRTTGVLTGINADGYATVVGGTPAISITSKIVGDVTNMGKAVAYYTQGSPATLTSTAIVADKGNATVTVPGDLSVASADSAKSTYVAKWLAANGLELSTATTDYIINNYIAGTGTPIAASDLANLGNYAVAYVIDKNNDGKIDAFVKTTKTVSEVTGATKTKVEDGKTLTSVPGVTAGYVNAIGAEDLAKGDLVMHIPYAGTTYITKCETVTGKITGYKGSTAIYLDGTSYTLSTGAFGGQSVAQMAALDSTAKKDVTLFLDENGNALFAKLVDSTSTYNVAIVLGYTTSGSSVEDESVASARLLMADGTISVVDVSGGNGTDILATNTLTSANHAVPANYYPVAYSIDADGKYELTKLTTSAVDFNSDKIKYTELTADSIAPGKASFSGDFTGVGTSNTNFVVANYNTSTTKLSTVNAYNGIAKAPKYTTSADGVVIDVGGVAALVFIVNGTLQDSSATSNYAFIPTSVAPTYSTADKTYTYADSYVNGEKQDIISKVILPQNAVIKVSLNDSDVVISQVAYNDSSLAGTHATGTGISYNGGVVTVDTRTGGTEAYYTLVDDAKVFEIASDGTITEVAPSGITADKTDSILVLGASDMATSLKAKYIYITKTETASNAFSVQAYTVGSTGAKTDQGSVANVGDDHSNVTPPATSNATTATVATSATVTIAATTAAKVGLTITGADGTTVNVPAEQVLVASDASYDFVVTCTSEKGLAQVCTITVTFTAVNA